MIVPDISPSSGIMIDIIEKKVMNKPYMCVDFGVKITADFKRPEEFLPMLAKALRYIDPETFNTDIMNRSNYWSESCKLRNR